MYERMNVEADLKRSILIDEFGSAVEEWEYIAEIMDEDIEEMYDKVFEANHIAPSWSEAAYNYGYEFISRETEEALEARFIHYGY